MSKRKENAVYEARETINKQHPTETPQPWNKFEKTSKNGFKSPKKGEQTWHVQSGKWLPVMEKG